MLLNEDCCDLNSTSIRPICHKLSTMAINCTIPTVGVGNCEK